MNKPEWPVLEDAIKVTDGFLVDREIAEGIRGGRLVTEGDVGQAKYACYEMRIGPDIRQLVMDHLPGGENDLYRGKRVDGDETFRIGPGETFKIYGLEKLWVPANVFAIAIPVGNIYKLGLSPETTFADPGFNGEFFVTVCNYSARVVRLKVGDPLARLFFFKLAGRPDRIHEGQPREIPPAIEKVRRPDLEELTRTGESALMDDVLRSVDPPHYQHAFVTHRIFAHHREEANAGIREIRRNMAAMTLVTVGSFLIVAVMAVVFVGQLFKAWWPSVFENLLAEFVAGIVIWLFILLAVGPFRRAVLGAMRTLTSKGAL